MEKIIISCLESRVETNRSIYARFLLGPFKDDKAVTIATALRRSLLSQVKSIAITAIHIQGVTHEFSTIVGVRESVLDLALNFQKVVLRVQSNNRSVQKGGVQNKGVQKRSFCTPNSFTSHAKASPLHTFTRGDTSKLVNQIGFNSDPVTSVKETAKIGYLQVQGPKVIYANDLKLPVGVECVDPTQYIATLSTEGLLVVKFVIGEKKMSFENNKEKLIANLSPEIQNGYQNIAPTQLLSKRSMGSKNEVCARVLAKISFLHAKAYAFAQLRFCKGGTRNKWDFPAGSTPVLAKINRGFLHAKASLLQPPIFDSTISLRNTIFLDPIFDSVFKVNYLIEKDDLFNQPRERILLELWTNGSIHPRQALHKASLSLISTFSIFRNVFHLDSL